MPVLQSRYDPREDRMLLSVQTGADKSTRQLWFNRRQWLGLLNQLVAMKIAPLDDPKPGQPRKGRPQPLPAQPDAVPVDSLRLKPAADGSIKLLFGISEKDGVGISLQKEGIADFQRMLEQQAERAGWDPRPALKRLAAGAAAAKAMKKAQGGQ